jgi:hypothetical protein
LWLKNGHGTRTAVTFDRMPLRRAWQARARSFGYCSIAQSDSNAPSNDTPRVITTTRPVGLGNGGGGFADQRTRPCRAQDDEVWDDTRITT